MFCASGRDLLIVPPLKGSKLRQPIEHLEVAQSQQKLRASVVTLIQSLCNLCCYEATPQQKFSWSPHTFPCRESDSLDAV